MVESLTGVAGSVTELEVLAVKALPAVGGSGILNVRDGMGLRLQFSFVLFSFLLKWKRLGR